MRFFWEVAGFLDPASHLGKIRQLVLKAHDDFDRNTERDTHVLPAAEVLRDKLVEMSLVDAFDRKEDSFQVIRSNLVENRHSGNLRLGRSGRRFHPRRRLRLLLWRHRRVSLVCYVQSKY